VASGCRPPSKNAAARVNPHTGQGLATIGGGAYTSELVKASVPYAVLACRHSAAQKRSVASRLAAQQDACQRVGARGAGNISLRTGVIAIPCRIGARTILSPFTVRNLVGARCAEHRAGSGSQARRLWVLERPAIAIAFSRTPSNSRTARISSNNSLPAASTVAWRMARRRCGLCPNARASGA
jgi:hypothetical protein